MRFPREELIAKRFPGEQVFARVINVVLPDKNGFEVQKDTRQGHEGANERAIERDGTGQLAVKISPAGSWGRPSPPIDDSERLDPRAQIRTQPRLLCVVC